MDHVGELITVSPDNEGFAFFYCSRNERERREPLSVLQSYIRQLSAAGSSGYMRKQLEDLCWKSRLRGSDLNFETCREQLLESVNLYEKTTLVLDALDECEPDSRHRLIAAIEFLLSTSERPLKVFISSRPDGDIRDSFLSRPNIDIQAIDNQGDIRVFVEKEIIKHRRWTKISPSLRDTIVKTLLDRSNGMQVFREAHIATGLLILGQVSMGGSADRTVTQAPYRRCHKG